MFPWYGFGEVKHGILVFSGLPDDRPDPGGMA
jgi:hypothetical protein